MDILESFIKLIDEEDERVDIKDLFKSKEEINRWEKLVNVFTSITIDSIPTNLKEVYDTYKLDRQEQITILAYVKFLELMVTGAEHAKEILKAEGEGEPNGEPEPVPERMYG
tara:strand:- start:289 stop:624 length:336 start_codon:yes stop_codon:yes gene_type:complete